LGASVLVIGGAAAEEEVLAREVQAGVENPSRVHLANGLSFPELAALIDSADLLVSNDTGPMHIGPALGVATIGIFAGGSPHHYRPPGPFDRCVQGNSMEEIEVEAVIDAMEEIWKHLDLD
jgi:ADP-heptose:LPS heptosyltransferase